MIIRIADPRRQIARESHHATRAGRPAVGSRRVPINHQSLLLGRAAGALGRARFPLLPAALLPCDRTHPRALVVKLTHGYLRCVLIFGLGPSYAELHGTPAPFFFPFRRDAA